MIRENYYGRTNPNHNRVSKPFPNFEANNPSDVFTQKCLCTTQEYFLPLETESSEIEQLEIRQRMYFTMYSTCTRMFVNSEPGKNPELPRLMTKQACM